MTSKKCYWGNSFHLPFMNTRRVRICPELPGKNTVFTCHYRLFLELPEGLGYFAPSATPNEAETV